MTRTTRRAPVQRRSRDRVERILEAAGELVASGGVAALTTRACADAAGVPVASIYEYFADKDDLLLALAERDTSEMDAAMTQALGDLEVLTVRSVTEATMRAFVEIYHRRPGFVRLWFQGRPNQALTDFGRAHNREIAKATFELLTGAGVIRKDVDPMVLELAVEIGDRIFEIAYADDLRGDERVLAEGSELLVAYLERYATPAGLNGITVPQPR